MKGKQLGIKPMINHKDVVENIRREIEDARGTHIWDDYVNALRLISQVVFTRSSGFILELIQNAEDSGLEVIEPGNFEIRINQQRVKISHNGRPFNESDVKAISGIRSSKKPERGFLGYLGIGFKSVLKITDRPEIYSNGFHVLGQDILPMKEVSRKIVFSSFGKELEDGYKGRCKFRGKGGREEEIQCSGETPDTK
jgi:hypothetical protein